MTSNLLLCSENISNQSIRCHSGSQSRRCAVSLFPPSTIEGSICEGSRNTHVFSWTRLPNQGTNDTWLMTHLRSGVGDFMISGIADSMTSNKAVSTCFDRDGLIVGRCSSATTVLKKIRERMAAEKPKKDIQKTEIDRRTVKGKDGQANAC